MKVRVKINRKLPESMTRQLTNQLTGLIESGALVAGSLLPSERALADTLGVARNVVRRSYEYLTSGGHVESEGRKGRRVSAAKRKSGAASASSKTSKKSASRTAKQASVKGGKTKAAATTARARKAR